MKLLDEETRKLLPPLYFNEDKGDAAIVVVKFFAPWSNWTWYATEGSPVDEDGMFDADKPKVDFLFFGLVDGFEKELGYFSLGELESVTGPAGLKIERDLYWEPRSLRELMENK